MSSSKDLSARIGDFIRNPDSGGFDALSLDLFHFQLSRNTPYRLFVEQLVRSPDSITRWQDIPAVPTHAFKLTGHPLTCGEKARVTFLTSGTTRESRGAHHFPDTSLYELAISQAWPIDSQTTFFIASSPRESPQSSLSHMCGHLNSGDETHFLFEDGRFHLGPLYLHISTGCPLTLVGTALAFLHLMEFSGPIPLPSGSQLVETGGYKGTNRVLTKPDFYQSLSDFFHLPPDHLHNEYGMTELSSQAYATGPDGRHRFPPWCRHLILNPETGRPVEPGETGYLLIHDLANLHSVAAIQTQDFARHHPDQSFTLLGRDPGALPRGCSRTIDHQLSR